MTLSSETTIKNERRSGPDLLCRAFAWLAIIAWLLFVLALVMAHYARPEMDTGLVRYWGIEVRTDWRPKLTLYLQYMLWATAALSGISLVLNYLRSRRRNDHLHLNIILLLLSCAGFLLYLYWYA
ncbi:MAG: hypothetical protein KKE94_18355 [Gammaproteobacteria bacterium]|uniref:hypothetical protein n=1 Tax=Rheinheimera sp. TaxID=1869214 RepID=UPI0040470E0B|nr:hypothetical protein [Gammaproteobacteria bacterium]